jgi:hypothetical protein
LAEISLPSLRHAKAGYNEQSQQCHRNPFHQILLSLPRQNQIETFQVKPESLNFPLPNIIIKSRKIQYLSDFSFCF